MNTMPDDVTFPVQVLREHAVALEAALTVCLADPGGKPVHRLRTETRRVEAQLLLLAKVPGLPDHRKQAERLRQALRRLRQAAGEVRDLDVQRKRLDELANATDKGELTDAQTREAEGMQHAVREGAAELRDHLKAKRDRAAGDLGDLLKQHQAKAARATEKLLKVLESAEGVSLPAEALLAQAEAVFLHPDLLGKSPVSEFTEDELHTVRKAAKAARYLAETLPRDGAGNGTVRRFETLQEAGGQWHDALELARAAKRQLGRRHELTVAISAERDQNLASYRNALANESGDAGRRNAAEEPGTAPPPGKAAAKAGAPARKPRQPAKALGKPVETTA